MKYNPQIHHRRSIRLQGYDYSQAGLYFITICCHNMVCRFGKVGVPLVGAQSTGAINENSATENTTPTMHLNNFGQIAYNEWLKLPERFFNAELDVFQIMPNHMHGIIILNDVRAPLAGARKTDAPNTDAPNTGAVATDPFNTHAASNDIRAGASPAPAPIGDIVGAYKSLVANECLAVFKNEWGERTGGSPAPTMGKLWQRNYYEHIIRDERAYQNISAYIINNPAKWYADKFYSI